MKNVKYLMLLLLAFFGGTELAGAHALWFEGSSTGKKNEPQKVRVYYGEYAAREIEPTAKWYSDLKSIEVFLIQPDQKKTRIALVDKGDHLEGSFTPAMDGSYLITGLHSTKELGGSTRYDFGSQLEIRIGGAATAINNAVQPYSLSIRPGVYAKGSGATLRLTKSGQPLAGQDVTLMTPAGWSKTYRTDSRGMVQAELLWSGTYVAEWGHSTSDKGTWHDKAYTATWMGLTTSFLVK